MRGVILIQRIILTIWIVAVAPMLGGTFAQAAEPIRQGTALSIGTFATAEMRWVLRLNWSEPQSIGDMYVINPAKHLDEINMPSQEVCKAVAEVNRGAACWGTTVQTR